MVLHVARLTLILASYHASAFTQPRSRVAAQRRLASTRAIITAADDAPKRAAPLARARRFAGRPLAALPLSEESTASRAIPLVSCLKMHIFPPRESGCPTPASRTGPRRAPPRVR